MYYLLCISQRTPWLFFEIPFILIQNSRHLKSLDNYIMLYFRHILIFNNKTKSKTILNLNLTLCRIQFYSDLSSAWKSEKEDWMFVYWAGVINIADSVRLHEQSNWDYFYIQSNNTQMPSCNTKSNLHFLATVPPRQMS